MVNISNLKVGTVSHYYDKIGVAVVEVTGSLHVGDHIKIAGSGEFTQTVDSIQVEHEKKESAKKGDTVGLKVIAPVHEGDEIIKMG